MSIFKPTYLYIKQHSITEKLYFGKTIREDVEKYMGSGHHWKSHCDYHGKEHVKTIWFCLFYDKDECNKFALAFSEQENIVESKEWLNQIVETGLDRYQEGVLGYKHSEETKAKISKAHIGKKLSPEHCKALTARILPKHTEETKAKMSKVRIGKRWKCSEDAKNNMSIGAKKRIHVPHTEETKLKISAIKKANVTEEFRNIMREFAKARTTSMPTTKGLVYPLHICPHCNKEGKGGAMKRYHFDNCKNFQ